MATVVVQRAHDAAGMFRRMKIELDGMVVARLKPGERQEVEVDPGPHILQARMDWCTSPLVGFTAVENATRTFRAQFPYASGLVRTFTDPGRAMVLDEVGPGRAAGPAPT